MAFWDFLHDANSEKKAAGATWNFLKSAVSPATNLVKADVVAPAKELVAQATGNPVAQANAQTQGRQALSGERQFLQSIPRGVVQLGQSVVGKKTVTPSNTPFKFLAGTEPIQSIPQIYSQERAVGHGAPFAFGVAGLTAATDSPVGPGKFLKGGAKVGVDEGLQRLAKASTEQDVRTIMKGTPPEIIDKVAPAIAQTKDPNIIQNIIQKAQQTNNPSYFRGSFGDNHSDVTWLTTSEKQANTFGKQAKAAAQGQEFDPELIDSTGVNVTKHSLTPPKKPLDATNGATLKTILGEDPRNRSGVIPGTDREKVLTYAKQNGYDAVKFQHHDATHYAVLDKNLIQTAPEPKVAESPRLPTGRPVYRAGEPFDPTQVNERGVSVTPSEHVAKHKFGDFWDKGEVEKLHLHKDAKIMPLNEIPPELYRKGEPFKGKKPTGKGTGRLEAVGDNNGDYEQIIAYAKSKGYDAVDLRRFGEREIRVINPSVLSKTKPTVTSKPGKAAVSKLSTPPPQKTDPFNDINDALNGRPASSGTAPVEGIKSASRKNAELLSHERGARFTASKAVGETASGSKGYFKELSQLKGKYDRVDLGGMIENIGPDQAESLFSQARKHIQSIPDATYHELGLHPQAARLNTQTAIRKVIFGENGGVPTASELKLIKVASPSLAKDIESKLPVHRKLFDLAAKLAGVPRALQSTGDLSMGGRQGLLVAARHPVLWARANKESVKYLKSDDYFKNSMEAIRKTPEYELGHKYGLATPAADNFNEEAYASADLVKKIPGVNKVVDASERAYNGGLTKLRTDLWSHTLQAYGGADQAEEVLGAKGMRDLAEAVNTLTGRGGKHGGLADKNINSLSTSLFSPRLWAARLNTLNPQYYARLSPAARKVALENAGAFAAVAGVVLGAASAMGAEVNTDARSSDFLKIKIGDTRYDIFGGLQQNIVFAWREISGEKKNSQTGDVTKFARSATDIVTGKSDAEAGVDTGFGTPTRLTQASDLVSNKLSPTFAFGAKVLEGKNRGGEPFNVTSKNPFENEIAKLFIPINLQGAYDTSKNVGSIPKGVALNAPDTFGIGTQTYGTENLSLSDKQKSELQLMKKNGASDADIKSTESFYQTLKGTPSVQHAGDKINHALAKGDLQGAQKIADDHNEKLAKNLEKWFEAHRGQTISKAQADALDSAIIELDSNSLERRLSSIQDNPVKYGG